jgi:tryptophan 7-halogenase
MQSGSIRSVVILGGGTAGWMTAIALARFLMPGVAVTLVESDEIGTVGVGEASVPIMAQFNAMMGIEEAAFLAATRGSYKLGIAFRDWAGPGTSYFHGFGDYGAPIDGIAAHHYWLKLREHGEQAPIADWSLPTQAALRGRFAPHDPRMPAQASYAHAYHFDAGLYAALLRQRAEAAGVRRQEGRVAQVEQHPESGHITALTLADGSRIAADFFIDCSGFAGLLIDKTLGSPWQDWTHWLPCDRAVVAPATAAGPPPSHTTSTAREAGWQWRIPLQHREGNGYVYASAFTDDQRAADLLMANLPGQPLADPRVIRFAAGHRTSFWMGNCVAIGLAGGFLEPLESTSIQLIQTSIARLIELWPTRGLDPALARAFNRDTGEEFARIRDFIILHYWPARRDEPLWQHVRHMALPDTLQDKIDRWMACARVPLLTQESYAEASWVAILLGNGLVPRGFDARLERIDPARIATAFQQRRAFIARLAEAMPPHQGTLDQLKG